jgi:hypothetical protein
MIMPHRSVDIDWPGLAALAFPPPEPASSAPAALARVLCTGHNARTGAPCKNSPIAGSNVCIAHGGRAPQVREAARKRVEERQAWELARKIAPDDVNVAVYGDPIAAVEWGLAYSRTLAQRLAGIVDRIPDDELRYKGKWGEQVRGELSAVQKALADLNSAANAALRLDLDARRLKISERSVTAIERALTAALESAGMDIEAQGRARQVLARELKAVT